MRRGLVRWLIGLLGIVALSFALAAVILALDDRQPQSSTQRQSSGWTARELHFIKDRELDDDNLRWHLKETYGFECPIVRINTAPDGRTSALYCRSGRKFIARKRDHAHPLIEPVDGDYDNTEN